MNDITLDDTPATGRRDQGFTLIELLIVIVILGVLATVTVFAVRGITDQGETSACQADKKTLETAIESYFAQEGGTVLTDATGTEAEVSDAAQQALVTAGFLRSTSTKYHVSADGKALIPLGDCAA